MGTEDYRETNLLVPSTTSLVKYDNRQVQATCQACGDSYIQTIWIRADRSEVPPDPFCPDCRARADLADSRDKHEREMAGAIARIRADWRSEYGVEGIFQAKTFENFKRAKQPKAFDLVSNWQGGSLLLWSDNIYGLGKTHLVCALANKLVEERDAVFERGNGSYIKLSCPVRYENENNLITRIRATFGKNDDSDEAIYRKLAEVPLLIIDDIGKIQPKSMDFTQSVHYRIVNDRYVHGRDIIVITNRPLKG